MNHQVTDRPAHWTDANQQLDPWALQDSHTGRLILTAARVTKRYPTYSKANAAVERKNQAYGAVRYRVTNVGR